MITLLCLICRFLFFVFVFLVVVGVCFNFFVGEVMRKNSNLITKQFVKGSNTHTRSTSIGSGALISFQRGHGRFMSEKKDTGGE